MQSLRSGVFVFSALASSLSIAVADDGPYFPQYTNKPLVAPSGDPTLNSAIPSLNTGTSIPPSTPMRTYSPTLQPTPAGTPGSLPSSSSTTNTLKPDQRSSIPATNSVPMMNSQQPVIAVPGTMSQYDPGPQPYWTGFRGMGWFGARPWNQQTNYGPYMASPAQYGGGCNTCPTCPTAPPNFDFGRAYDGFMTGW